MTHVCAPFTTRITRVYAEMTLQGPPLPGGPALPRKRGA